MHAMLSLELDKEASTEQIERLLAHLRDNGWMKIAKVNTTWFTTFNYGVTESDILVEAKKDVTAAAKYSGITAYDAVVNVSQSKPSIFKLNK